jgi:hypothetical protein
MGEDMTDIKFLQELFKKFVPAVISSKGLNHKKSKKPIHQGWLDITEEESTRLARNADYHDGPFMFLTGKTTKYITVDLDRKNELRKDHAEKIDGVLYWDNNYDESDYMNTLIIKTPSGGFHIVYKYEDGIKSGQLEKDVLIDILSDGKAMCFGPGYQILNRAMPTPTPTKLVQQIIFNNNINYGLQQVTTINTNSDTLYPSCNKNKIIDITRDYSSEINAAVNADFNWNVICSPDNKVFTLIPDTAVCTVDNSYVHTEHKHSYIVVSKWRVVAKCFSHKERTIVGNMSKRLREQFFPNELKDSFEEFMHSIIKFCHNYSLYRLDGFIWKACSSKPWIYDKVLSYEEFVNTNFSGSNVFIKNPRKFADVLKYMETVDNPDFPFLKKDIDFIGFDNCLVNIATYEVFTPKEAKTFAKKLVPRHNIKGLFSWYEIDTPLFDSIVQYQIGCEDVYMYFLAFIGRLFYRVKRFDNFNIVPLVKGHSGTGKSTILTVINKMFSPCSVGVINSNNEITFGLESKHDKELLIAHEIGDRFTDRLSSDLFKQMVSGEDISIPRKNKSAIDVTWGVPIFLCSNIHLSYADSQGSISRRLAMFKFEKYVQKKDITLESRIIDYELPALIAKCIRAYEFIIETIGNKSFWDVCPEYFHENIREMNEQTDYIFMFLTLPPGDNVFAGKDVYFMEQQGASMLMQEFKNKFMNYMRFKHPGVKYKWTSDYSSFNRLGYRVVHKNICKGCGSQAISGCCAKYSMANRSKRYFIENLVCVENIIDHHLE